MTQRQLVQALADSCKITRKTAKNLLDTLARTAVKEVKTNGVFILPGIGRLVRVDRSTGAPLDEPPDGSKIRFTEIEIPPPESAPKSTNKRKEPRTGGKTDWPANDAANRELGAQGE